ncbi:MAG: sterol desaturase family protein [Proteobacteria bacterium]|nr:sterol desaturase family protein [Pseudomonadota bacterium]
MEWILTMEPVVRLGSFLTLFAIMGLWELVAPTRRLRVAKWRRWGANLALVAVNNLAVRLLFPIAAVGAALWAEAQGVGVFHWLGLSGVTAVLLSVVLLDLAIYAQHRVSHAIPVLWRLHKVHHADIDFDVTSAIRFHPLEIILSMLYKLTLVVALGLPAVSVVLFEVLLNAAAMFNHGNVALPHAVDRVLRWFLVTPDMHRIHHSVVPRETHSNFGFNLTVWDRLFRSYVDQPESELVIGLPEIQDDRVQGLGWMLALPFRRPVTTRPAASVGSGHTAGTAAG